MTTINSSKGDAVEPRESWKTRSGFIMAAVGSAIGLANILKFPHVTGMNGGASFIVVYLMCLAVIGFPVLLAEVTIGRKARKNPVGTFAALGKNPRWTAWGALIVFTGFLVSSFYSALAGWILGYFVEALWGNLHTFTSAEEAVSHYHTLMAQPWWGVGFHGLFMLCCLSILYLGVRSGIEKGSKVMMPVLFLVLISLVIYGVGLPGAGKALTFLFQPDWSAITPSVLLIALGQSFFTISAGQGTMITYGSYLDRRTNLVTSCLPIILADTFISILAAIAVFTIVFSVGMEPTAGLGLIFHTLPVVFSQMTGGYVLAILFFALVGLAALTSEISAMEPVIAYLIDERKWTRHQATAVTGLGAFVVGIPSALSYNLLSHWTFDGKSILEMMDALCTSILIPLGGLAAVLLVGWFWGVKKAFSELEQGAGGLFDKNRWLRHYLRFSFQYGAPLLILLVLLNAWGLLPV